jgi:hypothetical protein
MPGSRYLNRSRIDSNNSIPSIAKSATNRLAFASDLRTHLTKMSISRRLRQAHASSPVYFWWPDLSCSYSRDMANQHHAD